MIRRPDWRERLSAYVLTVRAARFAPGTFDCALLAAGAVEAMTGQDPAAAFRRRYRSVQGGLKRLRETGHDGIEAAVAALFPPVPVALAGVGDIAVLAAEGPAVTAGAEVALGVVEGEHILVVTGAGLGFGPLLSAQRAYRVPAC